MYTFVLAIAIGQHVPPVIEIVPSQAPPVHVQDDYEHLAQRCASERKPLIVFSGIPVRPIVGLTVCQGHFVDTNKMVIVGIPANDWLDRHDLPGDASDEYIRAFVFSKMTAAPQRKEVRQTTMMPPPFRQQQSFRSAGRSGGSC